jgi:hypothetical protein
MIFKPLSHILLIASAHSFTPPIQQPTRIRSPSTLFAADTWSGQGASGAAGGAGSIEQIEFKIYPDGRVEETVRGVKGNNCHKVTEKINEMLGEVVASRPTEEMFEQEASVSETLYNKDTSSGWEGSSTW